MNEHRRGRRHREIRTNVGHGLREPAAIHPGRSDVVPRVRAPHHAELADDALVAGLAVEDADAATAFVRRFQAKVFGLALAVTHDPALADDVAQEAFLRAWRSASTYDGLRGSVVGVAADDHPQRGDRRRAGPAVRAGRRRRARSAAAGDARRPGGDRRHRRVGDDRRRGGAGAGPAARRCRPSRPGRSCWPCSAAARPRRSAAATACRSGTAKTRIRTGLRRLAARAARPATGHGGSRWVRGGTRQADDGHVDDHVDVVALGARRRRRAAAGRDGRPPAGAARRAGASTTRSPRRSADLLPAVPAVQPPLGFDEQVLGRLGRATPATQDAGPGRGAGGPGSPVPRPLVAVAVGAVGGWWATRVDDDADRRRRRAGAGQRRRRRRHGVDQRRRRRAGDGRRHRRRARRRVVPVPHDVRRRHDGRLRGVAAGQRRLDRAAPGRQATDVRDRRPRRRRHRPRLVDGLVRRRR